ncbi:GYD domain-containing protein [bacterium]|nr:GYD domain-containing protein [bacterium]
MPTYLIQATYTPEAWAAFIKNPQNARERTEAMIAKLGGRSLGVWYAFGDYDVVGITELPDNVASAAGAIMLAAGGAIKSAKTTPLLSMEEGIAAMQKAAELGASYRPPGQ